MEKREILYTKFNSRNCEKKSPFTEIEIKKTKQSENSFDEKKCFTSNN